MKVLAVLLLALASTSAGPVAAKFKPVHPRDRKIEQSIESRIVGGQTAVLGQYPYQVGITFNIYGWFCGGSIIAPNVIMTAAHCTDGAYLATVYAGSIDLEEGTKQTVLSTNFKQHLGFNRNTILHDISLIKLTEPLKFNNHIGQIGLPTNANDDYVGQVATASGWGRTADGQGLPEKLQAANVTVISNEACNNYYGIIQPSHMCTSTEKGQATCNGDSGGPLAINALSTGRKQIGIVSFGAAAGCTVAPSAYTRVSSYIDWIHTNAGF